MREGYSVLKRERERGGERHRRTERELREPASCCTLVGATPRISHEMTYMRGFFVMVISFSFFSFLALAPSYYLRSTAVVTPRLPVYFPVPCPLRPSPPCDLSCVVGCSGWLGWVMNL